ncbi:MAG: SUMF1/EgtB/PvdO family nonheme iron enzyme [Microcystis sp. LE17-20A]|uniref:SUMF1/EgtB/PvdO family nonheme iron enzyme n=1 Tax=unclassified Microcystis TaxID=2643300 RepID=UPI0022C7F86D|nr:MULTISPECIES: SUMF1/EgtB/PvdO family nonheme iron enzyme [unclassified Microcystis]MCZ8037564.1 SUMF1/EgtB/PvdO family nonheme iron enzyme [Microcystis sp. LE17-20A]MCZ8212232.1 SUMF1/EgtB/PvdO family nonheme iron enzyme [Microcystis sp. LE19-8.1F]
MKKSDIQIFLAHASEDKPAVLALHERLKQAGYKPWLDEKDLIPGQIWRDEIPKAIKASQIFLACLSAKSANKQGYIQRELRIALDTLGEMLPGTIFFIPMRLEECEIPDLRSAEVGLKLRDIHRLDYWEEDGFEQLERAITHQFKLEPEEPKQPLSIFNFEVVGVNAKGEQINKESKQSQYFREDLGKGITLEMVAIPGGTFLMGTEDEEIERLVKKFNWEGFRRERPQHEVTVPPFFMGKYPITQAQWKAIASRTDLKVKQDLDFKPAYFKDRPDSDRRPVEQVNWYDAIEFCARLSKLTVREYRLPSEAEWEYACRAGTTTPFYFGETITGELANYNASNTYADEPNGEYRNETTPVGQFPPNAFGLYDMHGNVREWCADTWHDNYDGAPTDGSVWRENGNDNRSPLRGGSWGYNPTYCRSAIRYDYYFRRVNRINNYGFRVVCVFGRTL